MRKILFILSLGLVFCSCTKEIFLDGDSIEAKLDLSAMMRSSDEEHFVYLMVSDKNGLTSAEEGAVITCTVNGKEVHTASDSGIGIPGKFKFRADFHPGDKVLLEASYRGLYAYSEVVVPQPVEIELVDTTKIVKYIEDGENDETRVTYMLDILIKDIPGENSYFRVGDMRHHIRHIFHREEDEGGNPLPPVIEDHLRVIASYPDIGRDPILHDDYMVSNGDDLLSTINPTNYFKVFSDRQFADDAAEVEMSFRADYLEKFNGMLQFFLPDNLKETEVISVNHIVIEHITPEAYRYYKALNSSRMFMYESFGGLLMEPVVIPSNVVGGVGFVNISMDSTIPIPIHHSMMEGFDTSTMAPIE